MSWYQDSRSASKARATHSEGFNLARGSSLVSTSPYLAPTPPSPTGATPHIVLQPTGVHLLPSLPTGTPDYARPFPSPNLEFFDTGAAASGGLGHGHGGYNTAPTTRPESVTYRWYCCSCGLEGGNYTIDQGCSNCHNHWRCDGCKVVKVVAK